MPTRKDGHIYPPVSFAENSRAAYHLQRKAKDQGIKVSRLIENIIGQWADVLDGEPNPFAPVIMAGLTAATDANGTANGAKKQGPKTQEEEARVESSLDQWL
jgi:hypothetical protein